MPASFPNELRKRIIEAKERGDTIAKIAQEKGVSERAVVRISRRYRDTGSFEPRPHYVRLARTSVLSSVRLDGTIIRRVFDDALNGDLFREHARVFLAPTPEPGNTVVMAKLSSHKVNGLVEMV